MFVASEELIRLFNFIGSLVCHQRPERTLWVGGHFLPVCARDTGAYIGLFLGYLLVLFLRKKGSSGPPNLYMSSIMMLPLFVDSFGQALGFWASTNDLRLFTGLLFGTALAPMLIYVFSLAMFKFKIPLIDKLQPNEAVLDSKDYWLDAKRLFVGIFFSVILFFAIRSLEGTTLTLFYWLLSIPIIAMVIWQFFIWPLLVLIGIARRIFRKVRT
ncbi:MAG: DUF2085 domain-containing protein [Candidatus Bathyarchaeia archaeon]